MSAIMSVAARSSSKKLCVSTPSIVQRDSGSHCSSLSMRSRDFAVPHTPNTCQIAPCSSMIARSTLQQQLDLDEWHPVHLLELEAGKRSIYVCTHALICACVGMHLPSEASILCNSRLVGVPSTVMISRSWSELHNRSSHDPVKPTCN